MPIQKKCKICKQPFQPFTTTAQACSPKCAIEYTQQQKRKKLAKEVREGRKRLKTKSDLLKEAQREFNKYIRLRDRDEPCISCGTTNPDIQYAAGHYLTVGGHPELRFNEDNCHKQCNKNCNKMLSGNIAAYRPNLIEKIGIERVEVLEGPHDPLHLSRDEIIDIKTHYRKKAREIEKSLLDK